MAVAPPGSVGGFDAQKAPGERSRAFPGLVKVSGVVPKSTSDGAKASIKAYTLDHVDQI